MKKNRKKQSPGELSLPQPSSSDLRGRQSVRATFKLTAQAIDALSILSVHLGIKQKSLFDHMIEDAKVLNQIAKELQTLEFDLPDRIQKTFVLSRKTLSCLERVSKSSDTSRDALVEYSLHRLLPLIEREREKHEKRKEVLHLLTDYVKEGRKVLEKAKRILGEDDPVYARVKEGVNAVVSTHGFVGAFVEKGKIIEDF